MCIEVFADPDPDSPPRLLVSYICLFSDQTIAWTSWDCAMTQQIGPGFWIYYYVFTVSDCNKKDRMTYVWENDNELKWIAASPGTYSLLVHKLHAQKAFLFTVRVTFDLLILSWSFAYRTVSLCAELHSAPIVLIVCRKGDGAVKRVLVSTDREYDNRQSALTIKANLYAPTVEAAYLFCKSCSLWPLMAVLSENYQ